jgi:hypothetical protein
MALKGNRGRQSSHLKWTCSTLTYVPGTRGSPLRAQAALGHMYLYLCNMAYTVIGTSGCMVLEDNVRAFVSD